MSEAPEFVPLTVEELQVYFPQYEILSFIAAGGMGAVYLANQNSIDRRVAIKVLPREMSSDEDFSAQFRAEAKVMSRLNHPNLIGFFDFGEVDGMLFIVMEFVDGKSLHHSAHGEAIEENAALEIAIGITEGVNHAHEAGILHRDIKPANVLLDKNAFPKLGDFGLARPVEESELGKVIFGTPGYTAPEVVEDPESIDERSDIYSIGAILYELLAGHLPETKYIAPSRQRDVDPAFDKVVQKAIAFDPDLRYPDTATFLKDLKKIKLFHERGEVAPTRTAPITAPKLEPDQPMVKLASSSGANKSTPPKRKKPAAPAPQYTAKASQSSNKIIFGLIALAVVAFVAILMTGKGSKEPVTEVAPEKTAETSSILDSEPIPQPLPVKKKKVVELPPLEELDKYSSLLKKGDFTTLPRTTVLHTASMRAFFLYDVPQDWQTAQRVAESHGGYLACADSSEVRAFMIDVMRHKTKTIWLGGGTAGDQGCKWINGKPWNFTNLTIEEEGVLSLADNGFIKSEDGSDKKPFIICWNMEGFQEGSIQRQLHRLKRTASTKTPTLPPGAVLTNKSIYFLVNERYPWIEAKNKANTLNARLAVPRDAVEYAFLSSIVLNNIPEGNGVWMGGQIRRNGFILWGDKEDKPKIDRWIEQPTTTGEEQGIQLVNGESLGWLAFPKTAKASGAIFEWKRKNNTQSSIIKKAANATAEPEAKKTPVTTTNYHSELLEKAKTANLARMTEKQEKAEKVVGDAKWAVNQWTRTLTENRKALIAAEIASYFKLAEKRLTLHPLPQTSKLPTSAREVLGRFYDKQDDINLEYQSNLLKLKTAMTDRLAAQSKVELDESNLKVSRSLKRASEQIKAMSSDEFQKYLVSGN